MSTIKSVTVTAIKNEYKKLSSKKKREYDLVENAVFNTDLRIIKFLTILGKVMVINGFKEFGLGLLMFLEDYK